MPSSTALVAGLLAVAASGFVRAEPSVELFDFEKRQLVSLPSRTAARDAVEPDVAVGKCKVFPGDSNWPTASKWAQLNTTIAGGLVQGIPAASVCYNGTVYNNYSPDQCTALENIWSFEFVRMDHPIEVISLMFEDLTCLPPTDRDTHGCTQGGYPVYVVNATTVAQVQGAVNFARENSVRLVVKNTGHDVSGRSLGAGALSVWTHHLKDIQYIDQYSTVGWSGSAFKVGAGVQGIDILAAAKNQSKRVVTGICDSVGTFGGYAQGGGHSILSSLHGLGADQILEFQVVIADGSFVTASATQNEDLFWAIRGGGGSTFGVVTSVVYKVYPDTTSTVATFDWSIEGSQISNDTFWAGISSYFSHFQNFTDNGLGAQWFLYPFYDLFSSGHAARIFISPFMAAGKTLVQTQALVQPWLDEMTALGITVNATWGEFSNYYDAYYSELVHTATGLMPYNMDYGSRLIPRANFDKTQKLNETVAAYRWFVEGQSGTVNGFQLGPTVAKGQPAGSQGNAVHPAWRDALSHSIFFNFWDLNATATAQIADRTDFADNTMDFIRNITVGSGSYIGESDRSEPNWQQAFFGSNYDQLLQIKKRRDPKGVFWAVQTVGSEAWELHTVNNLPTENGKLCRVS